jgi:hypothetical protein
MDEKGKESLMKGVAKDRRISVEDGQMRHGRKSRSVLVDGYKRHVLHDLDTGLIRAVGITPANAPEASVTDCAGALSSTIFTFWPVLKLFRLSFKPPLDFSTGALGQPQGLRPYRTSPRLRQKSEWHPIVREH